jgi:carbamoylphosphate synthase small subunit
MAYFLSNGPGDPAATGKYAVPVIKALMETGKPISASASATRCSASRSAARP